VSFVHFVIFVIQRLCACGQLRRPAPWSGSPHLQRQIAATDAQIDALVYELYGLTEGEIRIVEGRGGVWNAKGREKGRERRERFGEVGYDP